VEPTFLGLEEVLEIHAGLIELHGGSSGVRDMGLLESALSMPRAGSGGIYFHADVHEMAAAYLFHIVKNHPFIDGNKRTGAMSAYVFLRLNGFELTCTNEELVDLVLAIAENREDKPATAAFLRKHSG
jgi:death-on-curing protein